MVYPKIWGLGDSAVAESRIRGQEISGWGREEYSDAWSPGGMSAVYGPFRKIILEAGEEIGWIFWPDTFYNPTPTTRTSFNERIDAQQAFSIGSSGPLFFRIPSGRGTAYFTQLVTVGAQVTTESLNDTLLGGTGAQKLQEYQYLNRFALTAWETGMYEVHFAMNNMPDVGNPSALTDYFWVGNATYLEEDTTRQKPDLTGIYKDTMTKEWAGFAIDLSPFYDANKDYSIANVTFLHPQVWLVWFHHFGEYTQLFRTYDAGLNWVAFDLSSFYPGVVIETINAEGTFTPPIATQRTQYLAQDGVSRLHWMFNNTLVFPLSLRRVLVVTYYDNGGDAAPDSIDTMAVTEFDIDTGTIGYQDTFPLAGTGGLAVVPLGEDSWAIITYSAEVGGRFFIDTFDITFDAGATYDTRTPPARTVNITDINGYYEFLDPGETLPVIYYLVERGTSSGSLQFGNDMHSTDDLWDTAPVDPLMFVGPDSLPIGFAPNYRSDYDQGDYIGFPGLAAPLVNRQFPWIFSTLHAVPTWYADGVTLP